MSLAERLMKKTKLDGASMMSTSKFFDSKEHIITDVPVINLALSSYLDGGFDNELITLAGPSKHFKSALGLVMCASFQKKYPDGIIIFYDSEFGASKEYFNAAGVDIDRVIHIPIKNIEELKFDIMSKLEEISKEDHVMIFVDSIGNLASKKEIDDALSEKSVADMTRAKQLKSLFRMVTPYLKTMSIPMVVINHVYEEIGMFPKTIVGGGCLCKGTFIKLADGTLKAIEDMCVGDSVMTMDGAKTVTAVWDETNLENGNPLCYRVNMADGYSVACSETHPFLIDFSTSRSEWIEASDLQPGMSVVGEDIKVLTKIKSIEKLEKRSVFDISVEDAEHYVLENGAVTHNTGVMYSSSTVFIIGRRQVKNEGASEVLGWEFVLNIEKSRCIREKSAIPFTVTYEGGIEKYSGLLDIAKACGYVDMPVKGWYTRPSIENDRKWRRKETSGSEFWDPLLEDPGFCDAVHNMYKLGSSPSLVEELKDCLINASIDDNGDLE